MNIAYVADSDSATPTQQVSRAEVHCTKFSSKLRNLTTEPYPIQEQQSVDGVWHAPVQS